MDIIDGMPVRACTCGCKEFFAHQVCHLDVVTDSKNHFLRNCNGGNAAASIYEAGRPFGPYTCINCGLEYDELEDIPERITDAQPNDI